jgi:hypothetical protein
VSHLRPDIVLNVITWGNRTSVCMVMQRSPRARSVLWLHLRVRDFDLKPHSLLTCNALGCERPTCAEGTRSLKNIVLLILKQPRPSSAS